MGQIDHSLDITKGELRVTRGFCVEEPGVLIDFFLPGVDIGLVDDKTYVDSSLLHLSDRELLESPPVELDG
jgi:hypothetical protein